MQAWRSRAEDPVRGEARSQHAGESRGASALPLQPVPGLLSVHECALAFRRTHALLLSREHRWHVRAQALIALGIEPVMPSKVAPPAAKPKIAATKLSGARRRGKALTSCVSIFLSRKPSSEAAGADVKEDGDDVDSIDVACDVCGGLDDEEGNEIILCDGQGCGRAFHQHCLSKPLKRVPRCEWLCPSCSESSPAPSPPRAFPLDAVEHEAREGAADAARAHVPRGAAASTGSNKPRRSATTEGPPKRAAAVNAGASIATQSKPAPKAAAKPAPEPEPTGWDALRSRERVLQRLRAHLQLASVPEHVLCREAELHELLRFCQSRLASRTSGALYICGSPGLGKSLTAKQAFLRFGAGSSASAALVSPQPRATRAIAASLISEAALPKKRSSRRAAGPQPTAARTAARAGASTAGHRSCYINAFSVSSPSTMYPTIYHGLGFREQLADVTATKAALERAFIPGRKEAETTVPEGHRPARIAGGRAARAGSRGEGADGGGSGERGGVAPMCVVFIDELDQLLGKQHEVLYQLFEWAAAPGSRLILVGIANALDLTERFLPRLQARGAMPRLVAFPPYAPEELENIYRQRIAEAVSESADAATRRGGGDSSAVASAPSADVLRSAAVEAAVEPAALKFCAKKIAAASGDARRGLQVFMVAVDAALEEVRTALAEKASDGEPPVALASKTALSFKHVSLALTAAFKSNTVKLLSSLPQHQQLLLCCLVLRERRETALSESNKARCGRPAARRQCTIADLYHEYRQLCSTERLSPLPAHEIVPLCHNLASCGVFALGKVSQAHRVTSAAKYSKEMQQPLWLCTSEDELRSATKDLHVFQNILYAPQPDDAP